MISPAGIIVDGVDPREKDVVAVAEVQKGVIMNEKFDADLRSSGSGDVSIIPGCTDECAEVRNDDVGEPEVIIEEGSSGRQPKIAAIVDERRVDGLAKSELPAGR